MPERIPKPVLALLRAIHARTHHRRINWWIAHGELADALSVDPIELDRLILYAFERDWLRISSVPVLSVLITHEGIAQISRK